MWTKFNKQKQTNELERHLVVEIDDLGELRPEQNMTLLALLEPKTVLRIFKNYCTFILKTPKKYKYC